MSLSTLRPKKSQAAEYIHNETLTHPLRRLIKQNPHYNDKLQISRYPYRELARFHRQLQLRLMDLFAGRVFIEAFPIAIRTLLINNQKPDGFVTGIFRNNDHFFAMLIAYIVAVKDKAVEERLVVMRSVPPDTLKEKTWAVEIVPHCRFLYLDAQKFLVLHISVETRYIESFARELLRYDDSDEGVEGHALGKIRDFLSEQLSSMNILGSEYEFLALKSRETEGVCSSPYLDEDIKSMRSCERMFVSRASTFADVNGNPWPTLVIETGPAYYNPASRWYMHYAVDWWFTQSQGATKIVLLLFFDHAQEETIIEKWMYTADLPFKKRLVQTLIVNVCTGVKKANNQATEVSGDVLVLELDALLGREKRLGETDIVLDKEMLGVCTEGFLREWRNLGVGRSEALDQEKVHTPEKPSSSSSPPAASTFSPELPDSLQLPEYPPFTMPSALRPKNPFLPEESQTKT